MWFSNVIRCAKQRLMLVLLLPLGALGILLMLYFLWDIEQAPAWVQAIGSVGAILVAIWISERGHKRDSEAEKKASYADLSRMAWVCECACQEAIFALAEASSGKLFTKEGLSSERVQRCADTVRGFLANDLPHRLVNTMFTVIAELESASNDIAMLRENIAVADYEEWFKPRIAVIKACQSMCQAEHLRLAKLAGIDSETTQRINFP